MRGGEGGNQNLQKGKDNIGVEGGNRLAEKDGIKETGRKWNKYIGSLINLEESLFKQRTRMHWGGGAKRERVAD